VNKEFLWDVESLGGSSRGSGNSGSHCGRTWFGNLEFGSFLL
jgi:hypothetical protein